MTTRKRTWIRAVGAGALVATAMLAVEPLRAEDDRSKWWLSETGRRELGLSDQQSRQLESVFQWTLPRMRAEKEALAREEAALSALMVQAASDTAVGEAIDRVEAARAAANKTRTWMLVRMYRVLSPDQRVKLMAMHERREQERRTQRPCGDVPKQ